MRKHRLRNRIKSLVGSHIDPDKDEELKGSNIETEDNYRKIIELLKEEDQDDKDKLVGLIEEFHKRYQSIYERYDHITGKLKEKVRSKKENNSSSSSSSDTDSDDPSNKKKSKNGKLENEIYTEIDELKRKLAVETEEKEAINSECEAAFKKVQETERMFNESKLQADRLQEENSKLLADNETAMATIEEEKRNNEELRALLVQLKGEKEGFETELQNIKEEFSKTKEKLKTTEDEVSNMIQILETTEAEKRSLSEELSKQREIHESFKNETENKMTGIVEELELLKSQKTEIEKQKDNEILALEKKSEDKESEINHLQVELESIRSQKLETDIQLEKMSLQLDFLKLELANKAADEQKLLEETIEDLKSDLEIKGDEINSLTETVRNLEVKIRLTNQKLHVTEQMLNETEHDYARKEEKLHQENKSLTDKISTLSETIVSVKKEVQEKVHETLSVIDSLTVKFEEDYGHVTTRVNEITNEIQAVLSQLKRTRSEKQELQRKLEEMVMKLKIGEVENEKLMKSLENMNDKIKEMENKIHVKDEEIMNVVKDKIEAIRQLCMWADYQRGRCDHLQELLSRTTGGGGRKR
ncbi:hypothetical protein L6452_31638 [Arctium lappa]|uniref:Uncharacterized protein n=1 Tax=Arctium lappa TaxID=4217 RepID=A0ACB8Z2B7_ARCLA|nr:hypothetical protein L6452_31638 [Arctium lappa]